MSDGGGDAVSGSGESIAMVGVGSTGNVDGASEDEAANADPINNHKHRTNGVPIVDLTNRLCPRQQEPRFVSLTHDRLPTVTRLTIAT